MRTVSHRRCLRRKVGDQDRSEEPGKVGWYKDMAPREAAFYRKEIPATERLGVVGSRQSAAASLRTPFFKNFKKKKE